MGKEIKRVDAREGKGRFRESKIKDRRERSGHSGKIRGKGKGVEKRRKDMRKDCELLGN